MALRRISNDAISMNQSAPALPRKSILVHSATEGGRKTPTHKSPPSNAAVFKTRCMVRRGKIFILFFKGREQSRVAGRLLSKSFKPFIWRALAQKHKRTGRVERRRQSNSRVCTVRKHTPVM